MKKLPAAIAICAALIFAIASCSLSDLQSSAPVSSFSGIDGAAWVYSHPVEFQIDSLDRSATGRLVLSLRHSADYPYRNIWLEITQTHTADSIAATRCDTFEIMLADAFGRWYGSGMGASFRYNDTVAQIYTAYPGANVSIRQIMRTDTLPGIEQVGFMLVQ